MKRQRALGWAAAAAAGAALAGVFWLYLNPHLAVTLAAAVWACF